MTPLNKRNRRKNYPYLRGNRSGHHNTELKAWRSVIGQNEQLKPHKNIPDYMFNELSIGLTNVLRTSLCFCCFLFLFVFFVMLSTPLTVLVMFLYLFDNLITWICVYRRRRLPLICRIEPIKALLLNIWVFTWFSDILSFILLYFLAAIGLFSFSFNKTYPWAVKISRRKWIFLIDSLT